MTVELLNQNLKGKHKCNNLLSHSPKNNNSENNPKIKRKKSNLISDVKQWISTELSTLCLNNVDDRDLNSQMLLNVDEEHPLYPLLEIINNYAKVFEGILLIKDIFKNLT